MASPNPSSSSPSPASDVMISLLTPPILLSLIAVRSLENTLTSLGQASEEIFRGKRLPVLPLSAEKPPAD